MKDNKKQLDLRQLAVDREPTRAPRARRAWFTRCVVPAGVLAGFIGLFGWAARDSLLPAQAVTLTPVVVTKAQIKREGTPLFQAAGWVEPRPSLVVASALAPGVIREVLVIEGQRVEKGEPIAVLIDADAKLALAEAEANRARQAAEVDRAEAALTAARTNLEKPVVLRAAHAASEAAVAQLQRELRQLPYEIEAARTKHGLSERNVRSKELARDAITGRVLREARAELAVAENALRELEAREPTLRTQLAALDRRRDAIAEQLALLTDEKRLVAESRADLAVANAQRRQAELAVETAQLRLERMTVRSPIDGRVLSVEARPGQRLSGINPHSEQGSSAVAGLYDPANLQVRVDVRLEDVPQVQLGQPVNIETAALAASIVGEVVSVTTRADIQKNTLQIKAAITNPPELVKPEMLAKVTFLAPPSPVLQSGEAESPLRVFIPETLVIRSDAGPTVVVADLTAGVARHKAVTLGSSLAGGELVEVTGGLQPTDKLIVAGRESVHDGDRIRVTGVDRSYSTGAPPSRTAQLPAAG